LETGIMRERTKEDNWTKEIRIPYKKPTPKAYKRAKDFFLEITNGNETTAKTLIQIFGSALTGIALRKEFYYILGPANSGKSLLCKLVEYVMADFGTQASLSTFTGAKSGNISTELMRLIGYRFAPVLESIINNILNCLVINKASGGDKMQARNPHGKEVIFSPLFPIILAGNHFPDIQNKILWEKLVLICLEIEFIANPKKPNERQRKPRYFEELTADEEFMEAFLYILVEGAIGFNKNGQSVEWDHKLPKHITENNKRNMLDSFLEEECNTDYEEKKEEITKELEKKYKDAELDREVENEMKEFKVSKSIKMIKRSTFNEEYNFYRAKYGEKAMTPQQIGKEMNDKKYIAYKTEGIFVYAGIELKENLKKKMVKE
jgi:putative DNA primase/helicase